MELADASSVLSPLTDENSRSSQNSFGESEDSSHNRCKVEMEVPAEKVMSEDSLITEEMVKEESQLHKETLEEEMRLKAEHDEHMENMDEDLRREKYLRLQSLLTKSNAYTQFLLERMKRQREEEKKRQEKHGRLEKAKKQKKERQAELLKPVIGATMWPIDNVNGVVEPRSTCTENSTDVFLTSQQRRLTRSQERRENIIPCGEDSDSSLSWLSSQNSQKSHDLSAQRGQKRKTKKTMQDISKKLKLEKNFNMVENNVDDTDGLKQQDAPAECPKATESESHTAEAKDFVYLSELEDPVVENPTRIINGEPVPADQPVLFTGGVLRSYQVEGYKWLKILYENGINGILADEMGLGKTIQCIAIISHLVAMGVSGPYLICVPLSTLPNWFSEFKRFAPKVPIVLYHGSKEKRAELRNVIKKRCRIREDIEVHPVVITSYEITMNDRKLICKFEWKYLIVDEGHRIKNAASRLVRELKAYRGTHRLLLTGTPLQNNLSELWSLLNFLLPEIFNDLSSFEAWFDIENIAKEDADEKIVATEQKENILSMLHQILTPFMLRRLKSDVELIIPPKKEILVYAPFTKVQQTYYKALVDKSVSKLLDGKKSKEKVELKANGRPVRKASKHPVNYRNMLKSNCDDDDDIENLESWLKSVVELQKREGNEELNCRKNGLKYHSLVTVKLANVMMQLRKCCNHPYLLEYPLDPKSGDFMVDENLIRSCGKMLLLDKMLPQLKKQGHKVLIFSQMTSMLDVLQDYCYLRGIQYCRFDGKTPVEERQEQITDFNENEDIFLFLLSTRAGGLGINLTAADTVIVYDSDWNPQCDLQAQDRCHRIGQTRPVVVYKLITANTIDQKIVERAAAKRKLEKMVIHKGKFKSGMKHFTTSLTPVSPKDLMDLLKSDDHETIRGTDNNIISDDDLKKLLDRSDLYEKFSCAKKDKMSSEKNKATTPSLQWQDVEGVFKVVDSDETSGSLMCSILPRNAEN